MVTKETKMERQLRMWEGENFKEGENKTSKKQHGSFLLASSNTAILSTPTQLTHPNPEFIRNGWQTIFQLNINFNTPIHQGVKTCRLKSTDLDQ